MVKKNKNVSPNPKQITSKGAWTSEEDQKLAHYISIHGDRKWGSIPARAGLNRCGKSCRLRWLNYLRPGIKRGNISEDEEDLIIRLHNLLGNRWSLIAGRLPGRTDNEIKNHWNTHLSKKLLSIDDLNIKLNQKSNGPQATLPATHPPRAQPFPTLQLDPSEVSLTHDEFTNLNDNRNPRPWNELLEKDFEIDEFFDFRDSNLPGTGLLSGDQGKVLEHHHHKFQEFHGDGIYQNLLETVLEGSSGEHSTELDKDDRLDMDALVRLLDYDEDDSLFSFS